MNYPELKDICEYLNSFNTTNGLIGKLRSKPEYIERLEARFGNIHIREIIYLIMNDVIVPKTHCGKIGKFISIKDGYSPYCGLPKFGKGKCPKCANAVQEMKKKNNLERYGVENPAQLVSTREKMKKTTFERYGVEHGSQSEQSKKKCIETMKERYGVEHTSQLKENQEKRKNTMEERYGVHNALLLNRKSLEERYEEYKAKFLPKFKLLSTAEEYDAIRHHGIMKWECNDCNRVFDKVDQCLRCPTCNPYSSSEPEIELRDYIASILPEGTDVIHNSRNIVKNREIDIFIPSAKVGIEFCGEYWHRDEIRGGTYHQDKALAMREQGYRLLTIFNLDWEYKKELIKSRLDNILGVCKDKEYARKCSIHEISTDDSSNFQNEHHIQGSANAKIHLALKNSNNEIVAVMTFGSPRFDKKHQYELIRFCSKGTVVGAASKLLKHFEKTYNPSSLLSYADLDWSNGNLYEKLGFELNSISKPGYFYYDHKTKMHISRYKCQKSKLVAQFGFSTDMTESEMVEELGYWRITDCGNMVYIKKY